MRKKTAINIQQLNEYIKSNKEAFRQHQKSLPFGEKMQIAFSLAERDRAIKGATLLPKNNKRKSWK